MTFSKPSVSKNGSDYNWELNRFCTKPGYIIVGGASRLFKRFRDSHIGDKIISFCDIRWGTGNVYEKLSFTLVKITKPNYYYFGKITDWKRKHRFNI